MQKLQKLTLTMALQVKRANVAAKRDGLLEQVRVENRRLREITRQIDLLALTGFQSVLAGAEEVLLKD